MKGITGSKLGCAREAMWSGKGTWSSQPPLWTTGATPCCGTSASNVKHAAQSHSAHGTRQQRYLNTDPWQLLPGSVHSLAEQVCLLGGSEGSSCTRSQDPVRGSQVKVTIMVGTGIWMGQHYRQLRIYWFFPRAFTEKWSYWHLGLELLASKTVRE